MPLFDLYFNAPDGSRYMIAVESADLETVVHQFVTGTLPKEPQHRFVEENADNDGTLSLSVFAHATATWHNFDETAQEEK